MAGQINRGLLPNQFDRRIRKMAMNEYAEYPAEYAGVFKVETAEKGKDYREAEMTGLGGLREVAEGGTPDFDSPEEGHLKIVTYTKYGLMAVLTEEMIEDQLFGKVEAAAKSMGKSAPELVDAKAFRMLNLGDVAAASGGEESWDSLPIFSDSHVTLKSGDTIDNKAAAALSETALQAAFEHYQTLVDEAGHKIKMEPKTLVVPVSEQWIAKRLATQSGGITASSDTAESSGNLLTTNPSNGFVNSWQVIVSRNLTSSNNWFFLAKDHGMRIFWKKKFDIQVGTDFGSQNRMYRGTMRFGWGAFDYKGVYGSFVD